MTNLITDPKTIQGHLLLHRTTFHTGAHVPTKSIMLPRTLPAHSVPETNGEAAANGTAATMKPQIILMASPTGALASLVALSENSYRRLSSLTSQLINTLPQPGGLNPKAYRMPASSMQTTAEQAPGVDAGVGRSIVDGAMLARWTELASGRRGEIAGRVGYAGAEEVRAELEGVLGWDGMAYF